MQRLAEPMVTRPSIQEARGCLSSSVEFCRGSCDSTGASTALFADVQQVRLETIMHMQTVVDGVVSLGSAGGGGGGGTKDPRRRMLPGISDPRPQDLGLGKGGGRGGGVLGQGHQDLEGGGRGGGADT